MIIADLKPYSAMKDSGVPWLGDVPEHWEVCRLKSRLVRNDSGVWSDQPDDLGTIVLRSTEQTITGGWRIGNPARLSLTENQRSAALLVEGDLVVTKSSGSSSHIGKTSIVTKEVAALQCCFSNFMQRLHLDAGTCPELVWQFLNSAIGREQLVFQSTTTTGLGNLNGTILGHSWIAIPLLHEQAAIVRFLDYVDRRIQRTIRAKQKLIKLLEEQKQAIIHRAVTRGLDPNARLKPSGVEWLGDIPEHWEVRKLRSVLRRVTDRNRPDLSLLSVVREKGVILCDVTNKEKNHNFIPDDLTNYKVVRGGQFAVNKMKAWQGSYGVSHYDGIVSPAYYIFDINGVEGDYFHSAIRSKAYVPFFTQASDGVRIGQWDLSQSRMKEIPFLIPPLHEQAAILRYLGEVNASIIEAIDRAGCEISLLLEYRTRLIADVVTGKLDVREVAAQLPDGTAELGPIDEADAPIDAQEETEVGEEQEE